MSFGLSIVLYIVVYFPPAKHSACKSKVKSRKPKTIEVHGSCGPQKSLRTRIALQKVSLNSSTRILLSTILHLLQLSSCDPYPPRNAYFPTPAIQTNLINRHASIGIHSCERKQATHPLFENGDAQFQP